jgi:hypothetical protein
LLSAILTIRMGGATVIVEGPDGGELPEDVTIVLTHGGKQLEITSANNWKINVQPGTYEVQLKGGGDTLQVKEGQISVQRFGRQIVTIRRQDAAKPQAAESAATPSGNTAKELAGLWRIKEAANLVGEAYDGAVEMRVSSSGVVEMEWRDRRRRIVQTGVGLVEEGHLLAAWGTTPDYGFCLYKLLPEGRMEARWTMAGAAGRIATESASGGIPGKLEGKYNVRGTNNTGGEYTGSLSITKLGETYAATWSVPEGSYHGIGLRQGDYLAIAWSLQDGAPYGPVDYKLEGDTAQGRWTMINQTQLSFEILQREAAEGR